ncbi:MAG: carboxylating nicotinate-nucleotide diphosphorylase [Proteobacteria bacterium]|nr:carboxylating nicotinate-nucleotide diphosphorylase [Pseudomonadota bacterium]
MRLPQNIQNDVKRVLQEDIGNGDISAQLIDQDAVLEMNLLVREDAVLCGSAWFDEVFRQCDRAIKIKWSAGDGDRVKANTNLCTLSGLARALLSAERSALNFLQTLSGTATITRQYVDRISDTNCRILDTRKTIPQLRLAQKYAVVCGGGTNHRIGLFDAYLIKENHLAACGSIKAAVELGRTLHPERFLEVEVEDLDQLQQVIDAQADRALLDNFTVEKLKQAVTLNDRRIELEASGNITDENLLAFARTGIDFISIGALTKHLQAIDFSLRYS